MGTVGFTRRVVGEKEFFIYRNFLHVGVYITIQAEIKPREGASKVVADISGLSYSKRDHPMMALFEPYTGNDNYEFLTSYFSQVLTQEDRDYIRATNEAHEYIVFTEWLDAKKLYQIIQKVDNYQLEMMAKQFDSDDQTGFVQLTTSFSQLKTLVHLEAQRDSQVQISFFFE